MLTACFHRLLTSIGHLYHWDYKTSMKLIYIIDLRAIFVISITIFKCEFYYHLCQYIRPIF